MALGLDGPEVLRVTGQPVKNQHGEIMAPWETNYQKIKTDLYVCVCNGKCVCIVQYVHSFLRLPVCWVCCVTSIPGCSRVGCDVGLAGSEFYIALDAVGSVIQRPC